MKKHQIFEPVRNKKKKVQKHIMNIRAKIMRNNPPIVQDIATYVVSLVCKNLHIDIIKPEKPIYCKSNNKWYIIDIYIPSLRLAIEIDDESHNSKQKYDKERDRDLLSKNILTVRFKNNEVCSIDFYNKIRDVLEQRRDQLKEVVNIKPVYTVRDAEQVYGSYNTYKEAKCLASLLNKPVEVCEITGDTEIVKIKVNKYTGFKRRRRV